MPNEKDGMTGDGHAIATPRRRAPLLRPGVVAGSAVLIIPLFFVVLWASSASESIQAAVTNGLILLVAALGLAMFWGNSGIMSLGHAAFMAVGAYAGGIVTLDATVKASALPQLPAFLRDSAAGWPVGVLAVAVAVAVVALLSALPLLRIAGSAYVIASYAVLVVVNVVLNAATDWTRGAQTFYGLEGAISLWTVLASAAVAIVVTRAVRDSSGGLQLRASREDELAARAAGVNVEWRRMASWIISAFPAGIAGFMMGVFLSAFTPATFYLSITVTLVAMVLVGGLQTVSGVVVGVAIITVLLQVLQPLEDGFSLGIVDVGAISGLPQIGMGLVILATLYLRPKGLLGSWELDELLFRRARSVSENAPAKAPAAPRRPVRSSPAKVLSGTAISKRFEGVNALTGVDIEVREGAISGLIGPNGSGKTTLLNILSGVLPPTSGRVELAGQDITDWAPHRIVRAGVSRTFQNIRLFDDLTVLDNIRVGAMRGGRLTRDDERLARELLERLDLVGEASLLAATLPYGHQRRLEIARALAVRPDFLLLDEPAAGMNDAETEALRERLVAIRDEFGVGVLVVDHAVGMMMRLCEHISVLNEGHLIADARPSEVQRDPAVVEAYLGARGAAEAQLSSTHDR